MDFQAWKSFNPRISYPWRKILTSSRRSDLIICELKMTHDLLLRSKPFIFSRRIYSNSTAAFTMLSFIYAAISVLISECCGSFDIGKYFQFPGLIPHCKRILRLSKETWNADRQRARTFTLEAFLEWSLNTVNKTFVDAPLKVLLLQGIYNSEDFKTSTFGHLLFAKICLMIIYR